MEPGFIFLAIGYALLFLAFLGYLASISARQRRLEDRLEQLQGRADSK